MKPVSFKPIIHGLIATTLALSSTSAMETTAITMINPKGPVLPNPMQPPFEITIGGRTLNSNDTEAYLSDLSLTTVPAEIGNLSKLQYLGLWGNQLTTLPAEIGNLSKLQYLYLSKNQLTTVPAEIGNLSALQDLNLSGNPLAGSESQWAKRLKGAELKKFQSYCSTKKDLEIKTMMMLLANQLDASSSLADLLPEIVHLICSTHINYRLG